MLCLDKKLQQLFSLLVDIRSSIYSFLQKEGEQNLYKHICKVLSRIKGNRFIYIGLASTKDNSIRPVAHAGIGEQYLQIFKEAEKYFTEPSTVCITKGEQVVLNKISKVETSEPWKEKALEIGLHSAVSTAIKYDQDIIAVLSVYSNRINIYDSIDIEFYKGVSRDIGISITDFRKENQLKQNKRKYDDLINNLPQMIFEMDINGKITFVNKSAVHNFGYDLEEIYKMRILDFVDYKELGKAKDIFKTFVDTRHCKLHEIKAKKKNGKTFPILIHPNNIYNPKGEIIGYRGIVVNVFERQKLLHRLEDTLRGAINLLVKVVEQRDPYTKGHQDRASKLSLAIAKELNLGKDRLRELEIAAKIHDIGKNPIPSDILTKPTRLTESEFNILKEHPRNGYEILKEIKSFHVEADIILQHHERLDGSGYPQGLFGKDILVEAKILGVADVVEAMTSHRPYREALGIDVALEEIIKNKNKLYDSNIVDICVDLFKNKGFTF